MTRRLFTEIADIYDRMNHLLSLGLDRRWRRQAVRTIGGTPAQILDLACGTGDLTFALARAFPAAAILGVDLTPAMLERARQKNPFGHVTFAEANAEELTASVLNLRPSTFNLISCAFGFRNFGNKAKALHGIRGLTAPEGQLLVLEFFRSPHPVRRTLTDLWLRLLARLLVPGRKTAYDYLRHSMRQTMSEREFIALAREEGFELQKRRFLFPCCSCLLFRPTP